MRLLHCHIENFGKLSDFSYDFEDGLNVIHLENGMGKSTFASFLRVMFFGFSGESKRGEFENERRFYAPWQGGTYGGQITFQTGENTYILSRVFGKTVKGDTFRLQDADTLLDSTDYSTAIGEELLEIDADSFLRTVYVGQADCAECGATDRISAKLGNLAANTDDINNYETVNKRMTDMLNNLSAKRSTGKIAKLNKEINALQEEVRSKEVLEQAMRELGEKRDAAKKEKQRIRERQGELQKNIEVSSRAREILVKREQYKQAEQDQQHKKQELELERSYFPGEIPGREELADMQRCVNRLSILEKKQNSLGLSEAETKRFIQYEERFPMGAPSLSDIAGEQEQWNLYQRTKEMTAIKRQNLQSEIAHAQERQKAESMHRKQSATILFIVAVVLAVIAFAAPLAMGLRICMLICGIGVLMYGVVCITRKGRQAENPIVQLLQRECDEDARLLGDMETGLRHFLECYHLDFDAEKLSRNLQELMEQVRDYDNLAARKQESLTEVELKEQQKITDRMSAFVDAYSREQKFGSMQSLACMELLKDMEKHLDSYEKAQKEYDVYAGRKLTLEQKQGDLALQANPEMAENLERYKQEWKEADAQLEEVNRSLADYNRQMDEKTEEYEELAEKEEKLESLREEVLFLTRKYDIIQKTQDFLTKAKESFTAKYTKPLMDGFEKYYGCLTGNQTDAYAMNANMQVESKEQGLYRDTRHLSAGYQDLIGLCMRMAMVDAMYPAEKPFLVLDDPFVNLDEKKLQGSREFLEKLAEQYQVIYFTCHESRMLS